MDESRTSNNSASNHERHLHGHNVELEPLDLRVRVGHFDRATELKPLFHALTRLLFFHDSDALPAQNTTWRQCCLSGDRCSIIAPADELELLDGIHIDPVQWAVVQVSEGQHGFDSVGVVERVTGPLATAAVPVLYISTYATDFVLVPCDRLDEALAQFERSDAQLVQSVQRSSLGSQSDSGELPPPRSLPRSASGGSLAGAGGGGGPSQHPLSVLDDAKSHIFHISRSTLQQHVGALLRLLFMPLHDDSEHALVSLTETAEELSLLCGDAPWFLDYASKAEGVRISGSEAWLPIRIGPEAGTPLEEVGLIAKHANVLMSATIPILYHSTSASDFALVPDSDLELAIEAFVIAGFDVSRSSARVGD